MRSLREVLGRALENIEMDLAQVPCIRPFDIDIASALVGAPQCWEELLVKDLRNILIFF